MVGFHVFQRAAPTLFCFMLGCSSDSTSGNDSTGGMSGTGGSDTQGGSSSGGSGAAGSSAGGSGAGTGGVTAGGASHVADPCPTGEFINCASDCGGRECPKSDFDGCYSAVASSGVVRTMSGAEACKGCGDLLHLGVVLQPAGIYRVTVAPPWSLIPPPIAEAPVCIEGKQCIINGYTTGEYRGFMAVTRDPNAPPRNILIEAVPADVGPCPP